tara:strand:- start:286 stop:420 length:135 start_codon:yes stop_codon:yes gene_type:complete
MKTSPPKEVGISAVLSVSKFGKMAPRPNASAADRKVTDLLDTFE